MHFNTPKYATTSDWGRGGLLGFVKFFSEVFFSFALVAVTW